MRTLEVALVERPQRSRSTPSTALIDCALPNAKRQSPDRSTASAGGGMRRSPFGRRMPITITPRYRRPVSINFLPT